MDYKDMLDQSPKVLKEGELSIFMAPHTHGKEVVPCSATPLELYQIEPRLRRFNSVTGADVTPPFVGLIDYADMETRMVARLIELEKILDDEPKEEQKTEELTLEEFFERVRQKMANYYGLPKDIMFGGSSSATAAREKVMSKCYQIIIGDY